MGSAAASADSPCSEPTTAARSSLTNRYRSSYSQQALESRRRHDHGTRAQLPVLPQAGQDPSANLRSERECQHGAEGLVVRRAKGVVVPLRVVHDARERDGHLDRIPRLEARPILRGAGDMARKSQTSRQGISQTQSSSASVVQRPKPLGAEKVEFSPPPPPSNDRLTILSKRKS